MERETYLAAEERYDYSCEHLRRRIEASGLNLPEKYKKYKGKYLQWESDTSIGHHFRELKTIHSDRKKIKKGIKILKDENVIDRPVFSKSISERIENILLSLYGKGIKWDYSESSSNWLILIEPRSKKRVKIEIDTSGYGTNSIPLEQLANTLRLLAKKWNQPLNPNKLGEGTLTDCGWRANFPDEDRRAALDIAMSIHGRTHILKALKVTKISPWLSDYLRILDNDIAYVSKGRMHLKRHKKYDRLIYVTLL